MSNDLNNVNLQGRLYRDASFHKDKGYFTMAVNRSYRDEKAENGWTTVTTSVPCRVNGKLAEAIGSRLVKGVEVTVTGSLNTFNGNQKVFVKRGGNDVSIPDKQFLINIDTINVGKNPKQKDNFSSDDMDEEIPF